MLCRKMALLANGIKVFVQEGYHRKTSTESSQLKGDESLKGEMQFTPQELCATWYELGQKFKQLAKGAHTGRVQPCAVVREACREGLHARQPGGEHGQVAGRTAWGMQRCWVWQGTWGSMDESSEASQSRMQLHLGLPKMGRRFEQAIGSQLLEEPGAGCWWEACGRETG